MKTLSRGEKTGRHVCLRLLCHFPALSLAPDPSVFPPILSVRCVPAILVLYPLPVPTDTLKASVPLAKPKSGAPVKYYNHEKN